jgi:hypothetical protein
VDTLAHQSQVTKVGPLGGDGGVDQDITDTPGRLESITVQSGVVIDAIAFSYADQAGQKRSAGPWGGSGRCSNTVTENLNSEHFLFDRHVV